MRGYARSQTSHGHPKEWYDDGMCGRYTLRQNDIELAAMGTDIRHRITPRFNIAPSQPVPAFRMSPEGPLECRDLKWGLVPHWSKEAQPKYRTINARAETVKTKPVYRTPFKRQRCLLPAHGWYEWQQTGARIKQPYFFHFPDDRLFFFAGLWDHWEGRDGQSPIDSCCIIVTEANETAQPIHDRMPMIVDQNDYDHWLDPYHTDPDLLETLLRPYGKTDLQAHPVTLMVNNPRADGPQCVEPLE